ncbi:MAG: HigA family addiction module antitoxin [Spirochaetales bacterium]|nr:HigA family addiction module antitoxin [Spirochaetales bacterium]
MKRRPTHPGIVLKEDILVPLGISIAQAARNMGISRKTLSAIVNGRQAVTPNIALRIGKATNTTPQSWLNMQDRLDLWNEENNAEFNIIPFPVKEEQLIEM